MDGFRYFDAKMVIFQIISWYFRKFHFFLFQDVQKCLRLVLRFWRKTGLKTYSLNQTQNFQFHLFDLVTLVDLDLKCGHRKLKMVLLHLGISDTIHVDLLTAIRLYGHTDFILEMHISPRPIAGTAPHHRFASNYRQLPADYSSLPANYRHLYGFHYKGCLPLPVIYRQGWSIYPRLPPVMKNYRHVGNAITKSCTSISYDYIEDNDEHDRSSSTSTEILTLTWPVTSSVTPWTTILVFPR